MWPGPRPRPAQRALWVGHGVGPHTGKPVGSSPGALCSWQEPGGDAGTLSRSPPGASTTTRGAPRRLCPVSRHPPPFPTSLASANPQGLCTFHGRCLSALPGFGNDLPLGVLQALDRVPPPPPPSLPTPALRICARHLHSPHWSLHAPREEQGPRLAGHDFPPPGAEQASTAFALRTDERVNEWSGGTSGPSAVGTQTEAAPGSPWVCAGSLAPPWAARGGPGGP